MAGITGARECRTRPAAWPRSPRYTGRALTLIERSILVYSRGWIIFAAGIVEPLVYLLAFKIGFGPLAGTTIGPDGRSMTYAAFVAPALLVASAMNGAVYETFSVFYKVRYDRLYEAILATPVGTLDIALGEIGWAVLRSGLYALAFLAMVAAMGLAASWWSLLLLPLALLVACAFAAIGMVGATLIRSSSQFDFIQLAVVPMFLFSGTFYPLSVYPGALRLLVECSPLYQAIAPARSLTVGVVDGALAAHVAYLVVLAAIGLYATTKRLDSMLLR